MRYNAIKLLAITCFTFLLGCNVQPSLIGKKVYLFEPQNLTYMGVTATTEVIETELYFISKEELILNVKVIYGSKYKESVSEKHYNYTYDKGFLTVPQLSIPAIKLSESDNFYTSEDGTIFYKNSILNLPRAEKLSRLQKTVTNSAGDVEKSYLDKEIIYNE